MPNDDEALADYYRDPVGHCIGALEDPDDMVRFNAADILRGLARDAEPALPALIAHFTDPDYEVRVQCVFAVSNIVGCLESPPEFVIVPLQICLQSPEPEIISLASEGLKAYGVISSSLTPE